MLDPWERQPKGSPLILTGDGESAKAHAAFMDYARMGVAHSLRDLAARYRQAVVNGQSTPPTTKWTTTSKWSHNHSWVARAAAWDAEQERLRAVAHRQAVEDLARQDAERGRSLVAMAERIMERANQALAVLRPFQQEFVDEHGGTVRVLKSDFTPGDVANLGRAVAALLKAGSDLQRLALGEPTEIVGQRELEVRAEALAEELGIPKEEILVNFQEYRSRRGR